MDGIQEYVAEMMSKKANTATSPSPSPEPSPAPTPSPTPTPTQTPTSEPAPTPEPQKVTPTEPTVEPKNAVEPEAEKNIDDDLSPFAKALLGDADKQEENKQDVEPDDLDKLALPEKASVEAKDAFAKVNANRAELRKELKALKAERDELAKKANSVNLAEFENQKKELESQIEKYKSDYEQAEKKLYALDIKQTKQWKEMITEPVTLIKAQTDKIADAYNIDGKELRNALLIEDTRKLTEILTEAGVNKFDIDELSKIRVEAKRIASMEKALKEDAKEAYRMLTEQQEKEALAATEARRAEFSSAKEGMAGHVKKSYPFLFTEIPADTEWNKSVGIANGFIQNADPTQLTAQAMGEVMAMAAVAPVALQALDKVKAELASLTAKYKRVAKINPTSTPTHGVVHQQESNDSIEGFVKSRLSRRK